MAVSYPSLRDGLNLAPPYTEPAQNTSNSLMYLNQVSSLGSSYPGLWTENFVPGDSDVVSRTIRNNIPVQELSLRLGAEITGSVSVPSLEYHYLSTYPGAYQCEPVCVANRSILHSKYLKPLQMLLDEAVNIRKACKQENQSRFRSVRGSESNDSKENDGQCRNQPVPNPGESTSNSLELLSPTEKQELQNKKTKLLCMLDEVDKRYCQYYHEMQSLISSLEMVAGFGAAKPYTSVALQRISRNFRSLRDTTKTQIRATRSKLGEHETSVNEQGERIPRLRYVDQQIKQHRTYHQQIGTMRPVWRPPQRGLPESSVSILRAWLFEHFLHPYPKDSEKIMLAKQTGLTRNQVANWFINARVRLWKPMIEQMYKEEFGDPEVNATSSSRENEPKQPRESSQEPEPKSKQMLQETTKSIDPNPSEISKSFVGSNMADYHYMVLGMAAHQERFADPLQFHDFVV